MPYILGSRHHQLRLPCQHFQLEQISQSFRQSRRPQG
jgi:hypothetical protein